MDRLAHVLKWEAKKPALPAIRPSRAKQQAQYKKDRAKRDPIFKLTMVLRNRVRSALRSQGARKHRKTLRLLGCDTGHLKRHLESLWQPGMCWENYGEWHIDHKRPCASFDLLDPAEQCKCFHWSNLQPLWSYDNFRKHDKWEAHVPDGALMVINKTVLG